MIMTGLRRPDKLFWGEGNKNGLILGIFFLGSFYLVLGKNKELVTFGQVFTIGQHCIFKSVHLTTNTLHFVLKILGKLTPPPNQVQPVFQTKISGNCYTLYTSNGECFECKRLNPYCKRSILLNIKENLIKRLHHYRILMRTSHNMDEIKDNLLTQ